MNNDRPNDWNRHNHKDNFLNGALVIAIKVGLLLAMLEGVMLPQAPQAGSAALDFSETA